jgi:TusA-related sulfurtransferase
MANHSFNLIGYVCPVPLMHTKQKFSEITMGDSLVVETEHPRAVKNILDWAFREGHPIEIDELEAGLWKITLLKR